MKITCVIKCHHHPRYKAMRVPSGRCSGCWAIWELVTTIRVFSKKYRITHGS